jgi:hypothetical protein
MSRSLYTIQIIGGRHGEREIMRKKKGIQKEEKARQ